MAVRILILIGDAQLMKCKQHIYEDLPPYICTFEGCVSADHKYNRRRDWQRHQARYHNRHWICPFGCTGSIATESDFLKHLAKAHTQFIDVASAQRIADACAVADELSDLTCPRCRETMTTAKCWYKHLGHHLEQFALHALPQHVLSADSEDEEADIVDESDPEDEQIITHDMIDAVDEQLAGELDSQPEEVDDTDETVGRGVSSYWTASEQVDFVQYVGYFGPDFEAIAARMPNKTKAMLRNHYMRQTDGDRPSELEYLAFSAEERRSQGQDMGPLPQPTPIDSREYSYSQSQRSHLVRDADEGMVSVVKHGASEASATSSSPESESEPEQQNTWWATRENVELNRGLDTVCNSKDIVDGVKSGKTRVPKRLAHSEAIKEFGYPYEEEDDLFVLGVALSKERVDALILASKRWQSLESIAKHSQDEYEGTTAVPITPVIDDVTSDRKASNTTITAPLDTRRASQGASKPYESIEKSFQ